MGNHLSSEVREFLERLGRTVEEPREHRLVAKHKTALVEEKQEFAILDGPDAKPLKGKSKINIVGDGLAPLDEDDYQRAYTWEEFLDWTVDAERLSRDIVNDPAIQEKAAVFVPQHIKEGDRKHDLNALQFFLQNWLPDDNRRLLVLLGPAGYGKTVLTSALAKRMAEIYVESEDHQAKPKFPYLINFGDFRRLASFEGMILTSLQAKGITDYTAAAFAYLVTRSRVVLFLDGFDELLEERPDEAQKNLRELIETLEGKGKVIITARSTFFRTSDDVADFLAYYLEPSQVTVLDLAPFDEAQRRDLVSRRVAREPKAEQARQQNRIQNFVNSEGLAEAMGSPLLLNETIDALLDEGTTKFDQGTGRSGLFAALETSVYERERVRKTHRYSDEAQRMFLRSLAEELLRSNARGFDWEEVQVAASEAGDPEDDDPVQINMMADHHFLTVNSAETEVQFNHQVFREYFQAKAFVNGSLDGSDGWPTVMMAERPLPEGVTKFLVELDHEQLIPEHLLKLLKGIRNPRERLVNNVANICSAYGDTGLINKLLATVPADVPLDLTLKAQDFREASFNDRFFTSLKLIDVDVRGAAFNGTTINELTIADTDVTGADVSGLTVESLTIDFGERIFGTVKSLAALAKLGADAGLTEGEPAAAIVTTSNDKVKAVLASRLKRYYNPGEEGAPDGKWQKAIVERNLLGGVSPTEIKFVRSQVIPALLRAGVLVRKRAHGQVIFELTPAGEDAARVLLENDKFVGCVGDAFERLTS